MKTENHAVIVLGAGLAGLAAAYTLSKSNVDLAVLEAANSVGGLAKTIKYHGFRFDLGGHRFKTNNSKVEHFIRQLLHDELMLVNRTSKILLRNNYINYPLKPINAIVGLGFKDTSKIIIDYAIEIVKPRFNKTDIRSLEDWVIRHFGRRLFDIYFKEYSEKVWGIECNKICMEWVEQRIQKLSLWKALRQAFFNYYTRDTHTLTNNFLYPALGIGQIANTLCQRIEKNNIVFTNSRISQIYHSADKIIQVTTKVGRNIKQSCIHKGEEFISSIPLASVVLLLYPKPPIEIREAALKLKYRDLVIVTIMLNRERVTDQTWIYIPEKKIPFGRIHEPTNWSRKMAPAGKTLLVTEHFCFRGDAVWSATDQELTHNTIDSLVNLGLIKHDEVIDSVIVRIARAYPLFELGYTTQLKKIVHYLDNFKNLRLIGRAGLFRYYNMDHTIESGITSAEALLNERVDFFKKQTKIYYSTGTTT